MSQIAWVPPAREDARAPWQVVSEALGATRAQASVAVLRAATTVPLLESAAERDHRLRHQTRKLYGENARGAAPSLKQ